MRKGIALATATLVALALGGAMVSAADPPYAVDLAACDAAGATTFVPAGRPLFAHRSDVDREDPWPHHRLPARFTHDAHPRRHERAR